MVASLTFRLPIDPMPTPRPRARCITPAGRKPIVTMYSPKEYQEWQAEALRLLRSVAAMRFDGPVEVEVLCAAARPKTTKLFAPKWDVDNGAKSVLDAITKCEAIWADDTQVQKLVVTKTWTTGTPGVGVRVTAIEPAGFMARLRSYWADMFADL